MHVEYVDKGKYVLRKCMAKPEILNHEEGQSICNDYDERNEDGKEMYKGQQQIWKEKLPT